MDSSKHYRQFSIFAFQIYPCKVNDRRPGLCRPWTRRQHGASEDAHARISRHVAEHTCRVYVSLKLRCFALNRLIGRVILRPEVGSPFLQALRKRKERKAGVCKFGRSRA
jgi:hypothetical protein